MLKLPTLHCAHALLPGPSQPLHRSSDQHWHASQQGKKPTRAGWAATERRLILSRPSGSACSILGTTVSCQPWAFIVFYYTCSRSQASQDQGLGHLLFLFPNPSLFCARPGLSKGDASLLLKKVPPCLFCILSLTEARATRQHRQGPGRKQQSLYTKPTCGL